MRSTLYIILGFSILLFAACEGIFSDVTPRKVFDIFWKDFSSTYSYMDAYEFNKDQGFSSVPNYSVLRESDWQKKAQLNFETCYAKYNRIINKDSTWQTLWQNVFLDLVQLLGDQHFRILTLERNMQDPFKDGDFATYFQNEAKKEWPVKLYADDFKKFTYGIVKTSRNTKHTIGYIYVKELTKKDQSVMEGAIDNWIYLDKELKNIDVIVEKLRREQIDRIIFDLRTTAGGSLYIPLYIAGRFVTQSATAFKLLERDNKGDLTRYSTIEVSPQRNTPIASMPMALLTSKVTCSGSEYLALMLKTKDNIVHIGEPSRGCAGLIIERELPDGNIVRYTSTKSWQIKKDGTLYSYFKKGIQPDIRVDGDPTTKEDEIIEKAIEILDKDKVFSLLPDSSINK